MSIRRWLLILAVANPAWCCCVLPLPRFGGARAATAAPSADATLVGSPVEPASPVSSAPLRSPPR